MMNTRLAKLIVPVFLVVLSVACASEPEFTVKDVREIPGQRQIQSLKIDNRTGADTLKQDQKLAKSYRNSISLTLNGKQRLDEGKVRSRILEYYKFASEYSDIRKDCTVPLEAPAGKHLEYDAEWTEVLREGSIVEGREGQGDKLGEYRIVVNLNCQVVDVRALN